MATSADMYNAAPAMMEALEPFAAMWMALELIDAEKVGSDLLGHEDRAIFQTWGKRDTPKSAQITLGDLRRARAALALARGEPATDRGE